MRTRGIAFTLFKTQLRLLGAVIAMIMAFFVSALLSNVSTVELTPEQAALSAQMVPIISALNALILSYIVLRSHGYGWRLVAAVFLTQFGIETLLPQIETIVFNEALQLTSEQIVSIFLSGLIRAAVFAPLVVLNFGKWKQRDSDKSQFLNYPTASLIRRLNLLAVLYVLVYFIFGYFVAWQNDALRQYYTDSTALLPFSEHMLEVIVNDPSLVLIQWLRGYLWVLIVLPMIRLFKGSEWELWVALAIVYSVLLADFILFPNPLMPKIIRIAHFHELWSSMLCFGLFTGVVLTWPAGKPNDQD